MAEVRPSNTRKRAKTDAAYSGDFWRGRGSDPVAPVPAMDGENEIGTKAREGMGSAKPGKPGEKNAARGLGPAIIFAPFRVFRGRFQDF